MILRLLPSLDRRQTSRSGTHLREPPPAQFLRYLLTCSRSRSNAGVRSVFGARLSALGKDMNKMGAGLISIQDDEEDNSGEED